MQYFIKGIKNQIFILTAAIFIGGLIFSGCVSEVAEKTLDNKLTNSNRNSNAADGGGSINNSAENKSAKESDQTGLVEIYDGRKVDIEKKGTNAEKQFVEKEFAAKESEIMSLVKLECDDDSPKGVDIIGVADGAFTKSGAKQKAYLYERCRAGRSFGIGGILITENETVAAHYVYGENGLNSGIRSSPDVDKNGLSEIILIGGGTGQGYTVSAIDVFELDGGNLDFLGRTEVYSDNSGAAVDKTKVKTTAYKIFAESGGKEFSRETYEKEGNSEKWNLTKKSEKLSLDKKDAPKFAKVN